MCGGEAARRWGGAAVPLCVLRVCVCAAVAAGRATRAARPAHLVGADGEKLLAVRRVAHLVRVRVRVRGKGRLKTLPKLAGSVRSWGSARATWRCP